MRSSILAFASLLFVLACSAAPTDGGASDEFDDIDEALKGGCHYICPKCKPGEICPKIACFLDCHGQGGTTSCGANVCQQGEYCCNESCGICAPEGGGCIQQFCGGEPPPPEQCTTDADCRLFSSYCNACECFALLSSQPDPLCGGDVVQCFSDPCQETVAVCLSGQCTTAIGSSF
jgi:hypothetical protein